MSATARSLTPSSPWIVSPRWDMGWLSLSVVLVAVPPLAHTFWKVGATGIDLLVTLMIGGPHMYSTFLRTVLEPRFQKRHPLLVWLPAVGVPAAVVCASVYAFEGLLSFFFMWASIHICDQISYIASRYRARGGTTGSFDRLLDFAVALAALYVVAIYRFVDGTFLIANHTIWFPPILKQPWVPHAFAFGAAALISAWAVRTFNQWRAGRVGSPYVLFMGLTIVAAFLVPTMRELSVSFQGFNAWHSFQYLGLTFLALSRAQSAGAVTLGFVRGLSRPGHFLRYYGWNILLTLGAGLTVGVLVWVMRLPLEQCYYTVVLSFLLVHYFHDHVLFSDRAEAALATA